ncbi:MAG: PTS sugar transporter subunit IIA [Deltaproteobacteria bacterium]|nr:PTS sugar transporter subunit IIA [Deltaproteobacteria bacterium]
MDLKVRDVSRLLGVSEKTVYRWAKNGKLPSTRLHDQYLFNSVEIQEWAADSNHPISPALLEATEPARPVSTSLSDAIARGGIYRAVSGATREEVLEAVSRLRGIPDSADRALIARLLIGREALASTAVGDGIAIPHSRDPIVLGVDAPTVLLCFLANAVDFHALDGKPVRTLFTIICPSIPLHLKTLSRLAFALHDKAFRSKLREAAPDDALLAQIRATEVATKTGGDAPNTK